MSKGTAAGLGITIGAFDGMFVGFIYSVAAHTGELAPAPLIHGSLIGAIAGVLLTSFLASKRAV